MTAMVTDIKNLVGAIVAAGGGSSILMFAHPVQAVALNALAANGVGYPRRVLAITGVGPSETDVWYFGDGGTVEHLIIFSPACFMRQMLPVK